MSCRNENDLKQDNQSYEDRYKEVEDDILCDIKKHKPCLHIDYEELQNFNIIESDDKEDAAEFRMINHDLLHRDLEDSDQGLFQKLRAASGRYKKGYFSRKKS